MAANQIKGLTVEIGGDTTKLGKALESVSKKGRDLSAELGLINRQLKFDPGNAELLAQKQKVLTEAIDNTSEKLKTLKEAEKQVQAQFERGEVSEEQVRALRREIIGTEQQLDRYEDAAEETGKAIQKLGKKTDDSAKSTASAAEKWQKLGSVLKTTGKVLAAAFTAVSAVTVSVGKSIGDMTVNGAKYADTILTESTVTGIATDKLQEYQYAAELVDVDTQTLTKSMAKNIKSMASAASGSGAMADAYKQLGVSVADSNGELRDSEEVYWELIEALGNVDNETERDALAMQVLGKSAQELNPLIEAGADKMQELGAEAREAGYVLSEDTLEAYGRLDDQLQRLNTGAEAAKNALGVVLLPVLTDLAGEGVDLLNEFTEGINDANGDIGKIGTVIGETLSDAAEELVEFTPQLVDFIGGMASALLDQAPVLVDAAFGLVSQLGQSFLDGLPQLIDTGLQLALTLIDGFTQAIPQIVAAIPMLIEAIIPPLIGAIPDLLAAALELFRAINQAIPLIITELINELPTIITAITDMLTNSDTIALLLDASVECFMALIRAIPQITVALVKALPQILTAVLSFLTTLGAQVWQWVSQIITSVGQWGGNIAAKAREGMVKVATAVVTKLRELPGKVVEVGRNLVEGLWNGINNKLQWLKDKISSFTTSVLDGIKKFFGVHSPARSTGNLKTTDWVGDMLMQGLANGLLDNADAPIDAMKTVTGSVIDAAGSLNGVSLTRELTVRANTMATAQLRDPGLTKRLDAILGAIERGQVIALDGSSLVGGTLGRYDRALGQRLILAGRGAA